MAFSAPWWVKKGAIQNPGGGGGGGGGTPSGTVVTETGFGQASTAGSATAYSRGDHTHGTPVNPVTAHVAAGDPHAQYQLESEKNVANGYAGLNGSARVAIVNIAAGTPDGTKFVRDDGVLAVPPGGSGTPGSSVVSETSFGQSSGVGTSTDYARADHTHGTPTDPIVAHVAAADPHTQYQKESEKGAANGYASLGAGGLVPIPQLATGTPDGTKFVRDDGTLATPAGAMAIGGTVTGATTGSVLFSGPSSSLAQDNGNLFWDDTNNRLGIGNAAPDERLTVTGALRVTEEIYGQKVKLNNQVGTSYTLVAADSGKTVTLTNAAAITVTLPAGLPVGWNVTLNQLGAGQVTVTPSGTTMNNRQSHNKVAGQFGVASLLATASDVFTFFGDTAA